MYTIKTLFGNRKKKNDSKRQSLHPHQDFYIPTTTTTTSSHEHEPPPYPKTTNPFTSTLNQTPTTSPPTRRPISSLPPPPNPEETDFPPAYLPPATTLPDSPYAFLSTFDTIFLIDDSGSMAGRSWRETSDALAAIAPICTLHDADGIDIHFLNHPPSPSFLHLRSAASVAAVFRQVRPMGATPTGTRLYDLLRPYLAEVERKGAAAVKPLNVIVVTDGVPSDDVEAPIVAAAEKLDRWDAPAWQVGIQFFQVGNEMGAGRALQELDDELRGRSGCRDIVDTVPWSGREGVGLNGEGILKVVLGAVHKRLDRKKDSREWRR